MTRKQLVTLFVCNLVVFTVGNGLLALLPVYLTHLGADAATTGYYFSSAYIAVFASTVIAGWLSDRLQRRKWLLILAGTTAVPTIWVMGQTSNLGQLAVLTAILFLVLGVSLTMVSILAGLFAEEAERGRVFGIIASTVALGSVIGGLTSGPIVERWGFPTLFTVGTLVLLLLPLSGLLLDDKVVVRSQPGTTSGTARNAVLSRAFVLLFSASTIAFVANSELILAKPLIMDRLRFGATAISATATVGGVIGLPLPFLIGWLSDRFGRKPLLIVCYLATAMGLVILASALFLWHFGVTSALQIVISASIAVGSALVTDLVAQESLGAAIAWFAATNWVGYIIGFAITGAAINALGMTSTMLIGVLLALIAVILLLPIKRPTLKPMPMAG